MSAFRALLATETKVLLRDRMALFFTLAFPLIFILIFGFIMGDIGDVSRSTLAVHTADGADETLLDETLAAVGTMTVERYPSLPALQQAVVDREADFGLSWSGETLEFFYDANRVQENFAFRQVADGLASDLNLRRQDAAPPIVIERIEVEATASTSWFSQVLPGVLAFSVLASGLFAVSGHLTAMKERKILDRLIVTPMPPVALLAAIVVVRLVIVYLSTLITLFVGVLVFGLRYDVSWLRYTVFVACATAGTMGLGTLIALVVRRPSTASNIANVLAMLMMFLAGIYFPVEFMPAFLRAISKGLPLTHMADAMRYLTGVIEMSELRFWAITLSLLAIAVVLFPVLARYVVRPSRQ